MNLKDLTHDSHHSAQETVLGKAIMEGTITPFQYYIWLSVQSYIHAIIDEEMPYYCRRGAEFNLDLLDLLYSEKLSSEEMLKADEILEPAITKINNYLILDDVDGFTLFVTPELMMGAGYIMLGAHLMGGPKNKKHLEAAGYVCNHLSYRDGDRQLAREFLFKLRNIPKLADHANGFFKMVRDIMETIHSEQ